MSLRTFVRALCFLITVSQLSATAAPGQSNQSAAAAQLPPTWPTKDGTVNLSDFRFGTGETLPQLKLHYITLGTPHRNTAGHVDNAVLLLHGTGGNAHSLMNPLFSNVLFVPGGVLDIQKYFLILPDDIGHGESSKPSDGLHAHFPAYDYDDMVRAQRMMLDEMKIDHLRLILGTSMGCMQSFVWGETYPGFMDALAPFACLPVQIAGRNRMMRYMAIHAIKQDPAWMNGEYKTEPVEGLRTANEMLLIMGSSPLQMQKQAPTREQAEQYVDRLPRTDDGLYRRQQHAFLFECEPQLRSQPAPRNHHGACTLDQLGRRLYQSAGTRHCRDDGEAHSAWTLHSAPHHRCHAWAWNAHGCRNLEE